MSIGEREGLHTLRPPGRRARGETIYLCSSACVIPAFDPLPNMYFVSRDASESLPGHDDGIGLLASHVGKFLLGLAHGYITADENQELQLTAGLDGHDGCGQAFAGQFGGALSGVVATAERAGLLAAPAQLRRIAPFHY